MSRPRFFGPVCQPPNQPWSPKNHYSLPLVPRFQGILPCLGSNSSKAQRWDLEPQDLSVFPQAWTVRDDWFGNTPMGCTLHIWNLRFHLGSLHILYTSLHIYRWDCLLGVSAGSFAFHTKLSCFQSSAGYMCRELLSHSAWRSKRYCSPIVVRLSD